MNFSGTNHSYVIQQELLRTKYHVLYKAKNLVTDQIVVIKAIDAKWLRNDEVKSELRLEAETSKKLKHPNICATLAIFEEDSSIYVVREYVEGQSLRNLLDAQKNPLSIEQSLKLVGKILNALDYAHSNSVIHRHLNPDNIFITEDFEPKIIGFGKPNIAWLKVDSSDLAYHPIFFAAPEVYHGEYVSATSDIYSVGVISYMMLCKRLPWSLPANASYLQQKQESLSRPVLNPDFFGDRIPPWLFSIINKSLMIDKSLRIQTCAELLLALQKERSYPFEPATKIVEKRIIEPIEIPLPETLEERVPEPIEEAIPVVPVPEDIPTPQIDISEEEPVPIEPEPIDEAVPPEPIPEEIPAPPIDISEEEPIPIEPEPIDEAVPPEPIPEDIPAPQIDHLEETEFIDTEIFSVPSETDEIGIELEPSPLAAVEERAFVPATYEDKSKQHLSGAYEDPSIIDVVSSASLVEEETDIAEDFFDLFEALEKPDAIKVTVIEEIEDSSVTPTAPDINTSESLQMDTVVEEKSPVASQKFEDIRQAIPSSPQPAKPETKNIVKPEPEDDSMIHLKKLFKIMLLLSLGVIIFYAFKYYIFSDKPRFEQKAPQETVAEESSDEKFLPNKAIEMISVPADTVILGNMGAGADPDEFPIKKVRLRSYMVSIHEISQKEWLMVNSTNPSRFVDLNRPVENVSFYDAIDFCNAKSLQDGLNPCYSYDDETVICDFNANGYRLPTEAEWEHAAKGGIKEFFLTYSGSEDPDEAGWYNENSSASTQVMGSKAPNPLGLYDLSGNVFEWVWNWYSPYSYRVKDVYTGAESGTDKIIRGGSWYHDAHEMRVTNRNFAKPFSKTNYIGFRVVRTQ